MHVVAMGDSFTEGVGDERPDGSLRGWADRVAEGLARYADEPVYFANLAIRGRLLAPIVREQLPQALALNPTPTMVFLNGGGNDMMRPGFNLDQLCLITEMALDRIALSGARPVLLAGADPSAGLPMGGVIRRRGLEFTEAVKPIAAARDITMVDMFSNEEIRQGQYWSADRLHLNPNGHALVAANVLAALGYPVDPADAEQAPIPAPTTAENARYYREHVGPWLGRRLHRRSSGDGRTGKHADYVEIVSV